ncbi:hypothetical protein FLL45_03360 [Aliikangiella marina]|uniref:Alpha/beta hydrolase n=1 Tax=Aliikangiella marina TaxID=1712262 RepID=A0A545TIF2_9GAMM|nr:hypothetical protein [Aliikangiella marina]TQV77004.1 hypothetical protein FLL45_03360 [Aliikangiella marina]
MKRLAIAVVHGLGSEEEFYSVELKHRITEEYVKGAEGRLEDELLFHEIYWGDLVKDELASFRDKANYKGDLAYQNLRQIMTDTQALALLYSPGTKIYESINNRIKDSLRKFASHRRVLPDETPLLILAHSYGGVMMAHYIKEMQGLDSNLSNFETMKTLAGFITFGNPMGLYALDSAKSELGQPCNIVGSALDADMQKRARWYNFYDKDDIVAYPLKGLSDEYNEYVHGDFEINVGSAATSWNPACHTGYWEDKDFYRPVADFIAELRAPHSFWNS